MSLLSLALLVCALLSNKDCPGSGVDQLDRLPQCRRAGLYEQCKAIHEKGKLNLAHLTDEP